LVRTEDNNKNKKEIKIIPKIIYYTNYFLILLFIIARIIDIFLTDVGLSREFEEANLIARFLFERELNYIVYLGQITFILILFIVNFWFFRDKDLRDFGINLYLITLLLINSINYIGVLSNFILINNIL